MSNISSHIISLPDRDSTVRTGASLAQTLYNLPLTILLQGELGAGKTTFLQGFGQGLGIADTLLSPTYALEQRYATQTFGELLHIDLYRLKPAQARELLAATDDHPGLRCIEWPERLEIDLLQAFPHAIDLELSEEQHGRRLDVTFRDLPLPSSSDIAQWQEEVHLPENVREHCAVVAETAGRIADACLAQGLIVREEALLRAGEAHDLLRFLDFRSSAMPPGIVRTKEDEEQWKAWKDRYAGQKHEEAAASFLRERGFGSLADIVIMHGFHIPSPTRSTIEQRILFYADKRVLHDRVVTVDERFADFRERYGQGKESEQARHWYEETKAVERELFPDGATF